MSEEIISYIVETKDKKKYLKAHDFVGKTFNNGKMKVISVAGKDKYGVTLFNVTCTECSKDKELFPEGYFVSYKSSLVRGSIPCGCNKYDWEPFQYLILARRAGEGRFIVHNFMGEFEGHSTKLDLECLKDGHKWSASMDSILNGGSGCPKCSNVYKPTEQEALDKCKQICEDSNYEFLGFTDGYKNNLSRFGYICSKHGRQTVKYNNFVNNKTRCGDCARDLGNGNGYYPERKDEQDFLYVLNFDDRFIKMGRSFDVDERIKNLKKPSESGIKKIHKLNIFTATHQEIYNYEQELLQKLREQGFQYNVRWSKECFESVSLPFLDEILDKCCFVRVL